MTSEHETDEVPREATGPATTAPLTAAQRLAVALGTTEPPPAETVDVAD